MSEKGNDKNFVSEHGDLENETSQSRRDFLTKAAACTACVGAIAAAAPLFSSMAPDAGVNAVSSVEVDISSMKAGDVKVVMWRGKPVVVRRRTEQEIEAAKSTNLAELRDPQSDAERVMPGKEEWLVVVSVCTHLGCVPISGKGEYGGWFCPCHGSHYDTSGRIRKGPAPNNLIVPEYAFVNEKTIKIG